MSSPESRYSLPELAIMNEYCCIVAKSRCAIACSPVSGASTHERVKASAYQPSKNVGSAFTACSRNGQASWKRVLRR